MNRIEQIPAIEIVAEQVVTSDKNGNPLSYYSDGSWDFSQERDVGFNQPDKVGFEHIKSEYVAGIKGALQKVYNNDNLISVSMLIAIRTNLTRLATMIGSTDWRIIDNEKDFRDIKRLIKEKSYSLSTVQGLLTTINILHDIKLLVRVISNPKALAKKLCCPGKKDQKQAICIPERMYQEILREAESIVTKYHPFRKRISEAYEVYHDTLHRHKLSGKNTKHFKRDVGDKIEHQVKVDDFILEGQALAGRQIQAACLILVFGYSGVRLGEALSFNPKSYVERAFGNFTVPLLVGQITKTQVAGIPKKEAWVTHPLTKMALELAYEMSEYARKYYRPKHESEDKLIKKLESSFLNLSLENQKNGVIVTSLPDVFGRFISRLGIAATKEDVDEFDTLNPSRAGDLEVGEKLPKISPHDFRRTFAVFLVRNKLGSLSTLKYQYKHMNVMMSAWYGNHAEAGRMIDIEIDQELQTIIHEANLDVTTEALYQIYNSETLSGGKGKRILEERETHGYAGSIYFSKEELKREVKRGSVSIVEHPTGYCFKPDCMRICSSDRSKATCQYEVITPEKAKSRIPYRDGLIAKFNALNDDRFYMANILTDIALKIEGIERDLAEHHISFTPFNPEIKARTMLKEDDHE
jgi:integrase